MNTPEMLIAMYEKFRAALYAENLSDEETARLIIHTLREPFGEKVPFCVIDGVYCIGNARPESGIFLVSDGILDAVWFDRDMNPMAVAKREDA